MVTVATNPPPSGLKLEFLTNIDISTLSHSELQALSLCSDAAFNLRRTDDLVVPQIDRTLFNESAGSRRQTYSRLRLAPRPLDSTAAGHRRRLAGLLPAPKPPPAPARDDPERGENRLIVNFLKQLINGNDIKDSPSYHSQPQSQPQRVNSGLFREADTQLEASVQGMQIVVHPSERKRKRGRKPKLNVKNNDSGVELEIVNRNGVAVDLESLANADGLYSAELWRRARGLETEEAVLAFLRDLDGQWGSRRKKRKIVDASEFGDSLPVGWKLLLGLKRREGRVSVYCRRYISPTGQHFVSCKDAASYLRSYFGLNDANQPMEHSGEILQAYRLASGDHVGQNHKDDGDRQVIVSNSPSHISLISDAHEKEVNLLEIDNLAEVEVKDLFECYKCNMTFEEKNSYLQHLLTYHQRTTRRYRLGTSVGEGVIIKGGKYECQFCHKMFHERRSYNGHVGIHVRNYVRSSEESPIQGTVLKHTGSPSPDELPSRISKMDALIEIAQSSILETSGDEANEKPDRDYSPRKLNVDTLSEIPVAHSDHELCLDSRPMEMEDQMNDRSQNQELDQHNTVVCTSTEHPKLDEVEKYENTELKTGSGNSHIKSNHDIVIECVEKSFEETVVQSEAADQSMPSAQAPLSPATFTAISDEEQNEFCVVDQKPETDMAFEELRLDEIEPLKFSFVNGQEPLSLPQISMELANDSEMGEGLNSPVRFEAEPIMLNMAGRHQLMTVCVWCRVEFNHEAVDSESQLESVGFMCQSCRAKISGQLNVLDSGLSMDTHPF